MTTMSADQKAVHTATPWTRDQYGNVLGSPRELIRVVGFALSNGAEAKANSDFIVRACNSHADLVYALEACMARLQCANKFIECEEEISMAFHALASAESTK